MLFCECRDVKAVSQQLQGFPESLFPAVFIVGIVHQRMERILKCFRDQLFQTFRVTLCSGSPFREALVWQTFTSTKPASATTHRCESTEVQRVHVRCKDSCSFSPSRSVLTVVQNSDTECQPDLGLRCVNPNSMKPKMAPGGAENSRCNTHRDWFDVSDVNGLKQDAEALQKYPCPFSLLTSILRDSEALLQYTMFLKSA